MCSSDLSGTDSLSIFLTIPANGQIVGYLPEIIQSNGTPLLNQSFAGGTLFIQVPENSEGSITATVLRQSSGLLTTEPLAIYDSDSAIID